MGTSIVTSEPANPHRDGGFTRLRLKLAYDGTHFHGWAAQDGTDVRTVQTEVERALATVLRGEQLVRLTVSGRTDAGVHAREQWAHADVEAALLDGLDLSTLRSRMNALLPGDVQLSAVDIAPLGFDARFSPVSRLYRYRLSDRPETADPLRRHEVLAVDGPLDIPAMNAAGQRLLGLRDFAAFCRRREGATTVRTLLRCHTSRTDDGLVVVTVQADAFCHSMVRSLVGALLDIGQGRRGVAWIDELLSRQERTSQVQVAPARGLTLESVAFPPDEELAAQAVRTRRRREAPAGTPATPTG